MSSSPTPDRNDSLLARGLGTLSRLFARRGDTAPPELSLWESHADTRRRLFTAALADRSRVKGLIVRDVVWLDRAVLANAPETLDLDGFEEVQVLFDAAEGSALEDWELLGTPRTGLALFHWREGRWISGGKLLMNLNVDDVKSRLRYEPH